MKPLVSCICITQNRRFFLRQAVHYFERARWEFIHWDRFGSQCELVILDGSEQSLADEDGFIPWAKYSYPKETIRYYHEPSPPHSKTGVLHNRACELARGDIILQWDDDDWQSPDRIVNQVRALGGPSDQCREEYPNGAFAFTSEFWWYHLAERRACKARSWGPGGSCGATFAYHKKVWERTPFRDVDQGEDTFFWQDLEAAGIRFIDLKDPELVVYIRHNRNGSHAATDNFTDEDTARCRAALGGDLAFYDELSEILPLDQWNVRRRETLTYAEIQKLRATGRL